MGIKKYIVASLILLMGIGGYVFEFLEAGNYEVKIQVVDQLVTLPIALWVVAPAIVLFALTLVHLFYYGLKNYLLIRGIQKDNENLLSLMKQRLLGENIIFDFKSDEAKEISGILSQIDLKVTNADFNTTNTKVNTIVQNILTINSHKYVSSKELKLSSDNLLMYQSTKNRIDIDANFALDLLKQPEKSTVDILKYAFLNVVKNKSMTSIKKILENITLDIDMFKVLIHKDSKTHSESALDSSIVLELIKKIKINNNDLIEVAREYKQSMTPEQLIKFFEDIASQNEKFTESYLYVLSEYQMIDEMREILLNSQKDEYIVYKAYLDLRDAGKHYSLDTFI